MNSNSVFQKALSNLLVEIFDGPPGKEAYLLNPGDPGLLKHLDGLSAEAASTRPMPGKTTIAAHADHVYYGLSLLNRWVDGEANPWASADWDASWKRTTVTDQDWKSLRQQLRGATERWQDAVAKREEWDEIGATGALASAAHTAYHLGAIRQILASMNANTAPQ